MKSESLEPEAKDKTKIPGPLKVGDSKTQEKYRMNIIKIKNCPFCGGPAEIASSFAVTSEKYYTFVRCRLCRGQTRAFMAKEKPDLGNLVSWPCYDAILAWNLRSGSGNNEPEPEHREDGGID